MVATKQTRYYWTSSLPTKHKKRCEIRSGMSVQDLKQLTAQRQRLELLARNVSPRHGAVNADLNYASSPSSTCSSSLPASPPRYYNDGGCYSVNYGYMPVFNQRKLVSDKVFVTCGGQEIFFMEGVVNAPQGDV